MAIFSPSLANAKLSPFKPPSFSPLIVFQQLAGDPVSTILVGPSGLASGTAGCLRLPDIHAPRFLLNSGHVPPNLTFLPDHCCCLIFSCSWCHRRHRVRRKLVRLETKYQSAKGSCQLLIESGSHLCSSGSSDGPNLLHSTSHGMTRRFISMSSPVLASLSSWSVLNRSWNRLPLIRVRASDPRRDVPYAIAERYEGDRRGQAQGPARQVGGSRATKETHTKSGR